MKFLVVYENEEGKRKRFVISSSFARDKESAETIGKELIIRRMKNSDATKAKLISIVLRTKTA